MQRHPFLTGFFFLFVIFMLAVILLWAFTRLGMLGDIGVMPGDKVVVLEVEGVITKSEPVIEKLNRYRENKDIKAVVIRIDSPGGSVGPSQEIYEELIKLRSEKKIVASMSSVAASGGYYIASAAHKILANPGTITGSIGVIIEFANMEDLLNKIGLKAVVIKSGKYKDLLSPTRQLQDEERALLQEVIDTIHSQFIDAVALGRDMPREKVAAIADGRIFSGEQARRLGLVDELGNLQDAIKKAAELAGIPGKPNVIYPEKKRPSLLEFFVEGLLKGVENLRASGLKAEYLLPGVGER
jgi:protease-4